uniref:Malate dehydrogenase n=1 Tax=Heliothis virescens TaxID=7102 RepID=A0A2A4JUX8_HELVI
MGKVATPEAMRFMADCLKAAGAAAKAAEQQAELLIQADRFGHPSHGLNRLENYVKDIKSGVCKPNNKPKVLKETESTAWVDANNVLGATASHFAMDIAIQKAEETGVGWVSVKVSAIMGKVATPEAMRFMADCLKAAGAAAKAAEQQAELLIQADRFGHPSHGLNRLENYVKDIKSGVCKPNNKPKVLKETESTAWVDANNVLGATASHFAMDIAIQKAEETGVGWVSVKGSNHNGMAGFWSQKAADKCMIGMAFTNTSPLLAPTRSKKSALGTNPISVVAHASRGETFYLDMATTAVALGKIEMQRRKGEPLPSGWAQGPDGMETKEAELAFKTACLMPLGGSELTSGYKGYGLSAVVELFSGILAGANYGHHVRSWSQGKVAAPANLGHCFVAINPQCFAPGFRDRLADCIQHWRKLEPTDPELPVLAPGDKERKAADAVDAAGVVSYVKQQIESSAALAKTLNVRPMEVCLD